MKIIALALLILAPVANASSLSVCADKIALANEAVLTAQDSFGVGEANLTTVLGTELALLDQQFECRGILFADYCAAAKPKAASQLEYITADASQGQALQSEVKKAKLGLSAIEARCQ